MIGLEILQFAISDNSKLSKFTAVDLFKQYESCYYEIESRDKLEGNRHSMHAAILLIMKNLKTEILSREGILESIFLHSELRIKDRIAREVELTKGM